MSDLVFVAAWIGIGMAVCWASLVFVDLILMVLS